MIIVSAAKLAVAAPVTGHLLPRTSAPVSVLFCSSAVLNPRVGHARHGRTFSIYLCPLSGVVCVSCSLDAAAASSPSAMRSAVSTTTAAQYRHSQRLRADVKTQLTASTVTASSAEPLRQTTTTTTTTVPWRRQQHRQQVNLHAASSCSSSSSQQTVTSALMKQTGLALDVLATTTNRPTTNSLSTTTTTTTSSRPVRPSAACLGE